MNIFGLGGFGLSDLEQLALVGVVLTAFFSLLYAWLLRGTVLKKDKGTPKMQEVWNAIRVGADSYLGRQLRTILPLIAVLTVVLFFSIYIVPPSQEAREWHCIRIQGISATDHEALKACQSTLTI